MRGANPATTAGHEHPFWVRMPTEESVDHEVENDPSLLSPVRSALHHGLGQLHAYSRFSADEGSHGADAIPGRAHGHSFFRPRRPAHSFCRSALRSRGTQAGHGSGPHHLRARRTVGRAGGRNIVKTLCDDSGSQSRSRHRGRRDLPTGYGPDQRHLHLR